jgi:hypothetical protein
MYLWLLIIFTLTLQEGLSVIAVLLRAYQLHYPLWIIHVIWLIATSIEITFAYYFGKWTQKSLTHPKFTHWAEKSVSLFKKSVDKNGERIALVLLSTIISPALAAFFASWLDISFGNIFVFALVGDLLWYISTWATVLGAFQIISIEKYGLLILIGIAFILVLISHFRKNKSTL